MPCGHDLRSLLHAMAFVLRYTYEHTDPFPRPNRAIHKCLKCMWSFSVMSIITVNIELSAIICEF